MNSLSTKQYLKVAEKLPGDGFGWVDGEWKDVFEKAGLRTLEDFFSISGNALSKPGLGKRYRSQMDLKIGAETVSVFYKRYDGENRRAFLQRWWEDGERNAIAGREVNVAVALEAIGIPTFKPLAWGWTDKAGIEQRSFVVMSQVEGASMERWLPRAQLNWKQKKEVVEQLARFVRKIHHNGWFHRDLYLCHIFIKEREDAYQLALVDLARMFRPRWRVQRWLIKDLAQLHYSTDSQFCSRTLRLRFVKTYFDGEQIAGWQKQILRKIHRRSEQIRRRDLARQTK